MATRIYTYASGQGGTVNVTPSTWNFANQINPVTVQGTTFKNNGSAMTTKTEATGTTNPTARAMGRTVIGPMTSSGTLTGTIKGQMRGSESNAGANATLALAVKFIKPDGTDRNVALAQTASDNAAAPNELTTTTTNSKFCDAAENTSITLTSAAYTAGDYLVIEWGFRSATGTTRNIDLSYGNNSATDLPEDTSTTAANNPWWEFSATLDFTQAVTNAVISAGSSLAAMTLAYAMTLATIAATTLAAPTLAYAVTAPTVASGSVLYAPTITQPGTTALLAHAKGQSADTQTVTSDPFDSSGATLILAHVTYFDQLDIPGLLTDSKGNSWTPLTKKNVAGDISSRWYYSEPTTVGTSHTVTWDINAATSAYPTIQVQVWDGTIGSPFDVENGSTGSGSTLATGSVTPNEAYNVVVAGLGYENNSGGAVSIGGGFTISDTSTYTGGVNVGGSAAYLIQTSATAANPTWDITNAAANAATIAVFKAVSPSGALLPPTISSGNQLYAPSLAQTLVVGTIASGSTLAAPTLAYEVDLAAISSGNQLFAPTVSPGAVTLTNGFISSGSSLFAPSLAYVVSLPDSVTIFYIHSTSLSAPTLAYEVDLASISATQTFAPTLAYEVDLPAISSTLLYAPSLASAQALTGGFISSGSQLYAPSVAYAVDLPAISSTQLFAPSISTTYELTNGFISSGSQLFAPSLVATYELTLPTISSTTLSAPSLLATYDLTNGTIASGNQLFAPSLAYEVDLSTIIGTQLFAPSISTTYELTLSTISDTQLYAPSVAGADSLSLPTISDTQLYAPTVSPGAVTLVNEAIASGNQRFAPSVFAEQALSLPTILSTQVFAPSVLAVYSLSLPTVSSGSQLFAPSLQAVYSLGLPTISAGARFAPSVSATYELTNGTIASGSQVFAPSVSYSLSLPSISGTQLYPATAIDFNIALPTLAHTSLHAPRVTNISFPVEGLTASNVVITVGSATASITVGVGSEVGITVGVASNVGITVGDGEEA